MAVPMSTSSTCSEASGRVQIELDCERRGGKMKQEVKREGKQTKRGAKDQEAKRVQGRKGWII